MVPPRARSKAIFVPLSFAACGGLLLALLVSLVGCGGADFESETGQNAVVLCSCECESPTTVLSPNVIVAGSDDAAQALPQPAAVLDGSVLELGQQGHVGLRFQAIGVPLGATITSAHIQFTAAAISTANDIADLKIRVVDPSNASAFTTTTDLKSIVVINAVVDWLPGDWNLDEAIASEKTPDLAGLLQSIVEHPQYTPDSAVAFIITGSGRRTARSLEGSVSKPGPAALTIGYQPKDTAQEFLACPTRAEQPEMVCEGRVQSSVSALAIACQVATGCTCKAKDTDTNAFRDVCNAPCPAITPPASCTPADYASATAPTGGKPVCIANAPLGPARFARSSACELESRETGDRVGSESSVRLRASRPARGEPSGSPPI
jgi:hypothetical protein